MVNRVGLCYNFCGVLKFWNISFLECEYNRINFNIIISIQISIVKIFISYSRMDASETAKTIHNYLTKIGHHEVFIDTSNIRGGDEWWKTIQENISDCDIFVIIVTPSALYRPEVEKEVVLAKNLKKKIIPCIAKDYVDENEIKWELNKYQGYFYESDSKLAMHLHKMIKREVKAQTKPSYFTSVSEKQNLEKAKTVNTIKKNENRSNNDSECSSTSNDISNINQLKIFISYSQRDGSDFAKHIQRYLIGFPNDVFIDIDSIRVEEPWTNSIFENISICDIFVVILTPDSLMSPRVEDEVLHAQRENKVIVPCISADIAYNDIKWGLEKIQGIEFSYEYQLTRKIYSKIKNYKNLQHEKQDYISQQNAVQHTNISEDVDALNEKGVVLYEQGKYQEAIESYDKALKIDSNNESARYNRFLALLYLSEKTRQYT